MLQEAAFTFGSANLAWRAPFTISDNTPTVDWNFQEAFTVNPVVADLLRLRSLVNLQFKITLIVFYHPGPQNTMDDDASRKFHLAPDIFLYLFSTTYPPPTVSSYIARLTPAFQNSFLSDLRAVQIAVQVGHVSCENASKKYSYWMSFCTEIKMDYMLEDPEDPVIEIL